MTQIIGDLARGRISEDIQIAAGVIARERVHHEYNRFGYSTEERIEKIEAGIVGELLFGQYLRKHSIPALYYMVLGQYDAGYDWRAGSLRIDVKTTLLSSWQGSLDDARKVIFEKFHFYIADDKGQAQKQGADVYVQTFIVGGWGILAGYLREVPSKVVDNRRNVFQAKGCPISELEPMSRLAGLDEMRPVCSSCGGMFQPRQRTVERSGTAGVIQVSDTVQELMADSYRRFDKLLCNNCSQR